MKLPNRAYCSDRLKCFDAVGFDMDFTLCRYNTLNLMKLIHSEMVKYLVHHQQYPKALLDSSFDENISQKGLCLDKTTGLILKVSRNLRVVKASFGRRFLDDLEVRSFYPEPLSIAPDLDKRFQRFDSPWTLPMISILADFIEILGFEMKSTDPSVWEKLSKDIYKSCYFVYYAFDYPKAHIDAKFPELEGHDWKISPPVYFASILEDPSKYIQKCDRLRFIKELREAGVKTFIVTDSSFEFAEFVLRFLFGEEWNSLFDIILTNTKKPKGFSKPEQSFKAAGIKGPDGFYVREEKSHEVKWEELKQFHTYGCGNKAKLTEFLGRLSNDTDPEKLKVLFVGDSLKSDVINMKKEERYSWMYAWVETGIESLRCLDHSLVEKHAQLDSRTSEWGHMLTAGSELSFFGAKVKYETDYVMSDILELGGRKNLIKTCEFFDLLHTNSKTGCL